MLILVQWKFPWENGTDNHAVFVSYMSRELLKRYFSATNIPDKLHKVSNARMLTMRREITTDSSAPRQLLKKDVGTHQYFTFCEA